MLRLDGAGLETEADAAAALGLTGSTFPARKALSQVKRIGHDGVARASWPIELWEEGRLGATYEWLDDRAHYDIPLRSLRARDVDNLFVAGRCMSATHEALGSARVIGTCLATGEAVGRAAARRAEAK